MRLINGNGRGSILLDTNRNSLSKSADRDFIGISEPRAIADGGAFQFVENLSIYTDNQVSNDVAIGIGDMAYRAAGPDNALIEGDGGDNSLVDTSGDDTINAFGGNDTITVTRGFDNVDGGADRDRLIINYSAATQGISNLGGAFSGSVAAGYSGIIWQGNTAFYVNFSGIEDFTFTGGTSSDGIALGDGDDIANMGDADDFVDFGAGNNSGDGGAGEDGFSVNLGAATAAVNINLVTGNATFSNFEFFGTITTGSGNDTIATRSIFRNETINTGGGNDTITVSRGSDTVNGGADRDRLIIDYSTATQGVGNLGGNFSGSVAAGYSGIIWQGNSNYRIDFSGIEDFTFTGSSSSDNIALGDGDDIANMGDSDDFVDFGAGNDSGDGGAGEDGFSANLSSSTAAIGINLVTGVSATFSNFEFLGTLTTGSGNDTIVTRGINRNETINTGAGNDTITVMRGSDTVNGGADRDRLIIDYSTATQGVGNLGGNFSGSVGAGYSGIIWQGNSVYRVDFSGIEDFTFMGSSSGDSIALGDGNDIANMGDGDDFVDFGAGNDSGDGGAGDDGFSANLSSTTTAISINLVTGVSATFSNFEFLGTLTTGSGNDTIVTRGINRNETINTGAGNDTITVARGTDTVDGGADRDRLIIDYSAATQGLSNRGGNFSGSVGAGYSGSIWQGNSGYWVDFTGIEDFTVTGGSSNDGISLGDGNDIANMGDGDDFVDFGAGSDSGDGGTGIDGFSANMGAATAAIGINLVTGVSAAFSNFEYLGTLTTGSGNDTIVTRADVAGNETINTGAGADTITVARGTDFVNGGADRDRLIIDYSGATQGLSNRGGNFSGSVGAGYSGSIWQNNSLYWVDFSGIEDFTVIGSASNDGIVLADGDDIIDLRGGDDFADAGGGNDLVYGAEGNDTLFGGLGIDTLTYETAVAGVMVNLAITTAQNTIGAGTDTLAGFENLIGSGFNDTLTGSNGNNSIYGGNGTDTLNGGDGNDMLDGGAGADTMVGGLGDDVYIVDNASDVVTELNGQGFDEIRTALAVFSMASIANVEDLTGTSNAGQTLTGNAEDNEITGADGNDIIDGGVGGDTMVGGLGNDVYIVDSAFDFVSEASGQGTDEIRTALTSFSLAAIANVENLTGTFAGGQTLTGNSLANTITGASGNDTINGGTGADTMVGGLGNDIYIVDDAGDVVTELSGQGTDEIRTTLAVFTLASTANVENLTGTAAFAQSLTGNSGANTITGGAGADSLYGGAGNDIIIAQVNDAVLDGGADYDTLVFNGTGTVVGTISGFEALTIGGGAITVSSSQLYSGFGTIAPYTPSLALGGTGSLIINLGATDTEFYLTQVTGGAGVTVTVNGSATDDVIKGVINSVNVINGGDGWDFLRGGLLGDTINGGDGNDKITGYGGADTLTGGAGIDQFRLLGQGDSGTGAAADRITDFVIGTDLLDFRLFDIDPVTAGVQNPGFSFIGTNTFSHSNSPEIRFGVSGSDLLVQVDVDGNGSADMEVVLQGLGAQTLTATDFWL